jgi:hypothetical protein
MPREESWRAFIRRFVEKKPLSILRFELDNWDRLRESRRGLTQFTIARPHDMVDEVSVPSICIIFGTSEEDQGAYVGVVSGKAAVTTLESRISVHRCAEIYPDTKAALIDMMSHRGHISSLRRALRTGSSVVVLSRKLSTHLVEILASLGENRAPFRTISEYLSEPTRFQGPRSMQEDALRTALKAFGLGGNYLAQSLEIIEGRESALARVGVMEDSVIEHDARSIPGYDLVGSDLTGRAVFEKGNQRLEVFTANRRPLERVFGVDLIYLNSSMQNIVMLQYKMLEYVEVDDETTDWIYRPDSKLDDEIGRMRRFGKGLSPDPYDYRLNPAVFFLKFVKRDALLGKGTVIMPIDHFEILRTNPECRGPRGGLIVSFESLSGRYLRQTGFLDLISSGYIGAHATDTANLKALVNSVLKNNKAVVAAIQESADEIEET